MTEHHGRHYVKLKVGEKDTAAMPVMLCAQQQNLSHLRNLSARHLLRAAFHETLSARHVPEAELFEMIEARDEDDSLPLALRVGLRDGSIWLGYLTQEGFVVSVCRAKRLERSAFDQRASFQSAIIDTDDRLGAFCTGPNIYLDAYAWIAEYNCFQQLNAGNFDYIAVASIKTPGTGRGVYHGNMSHASRALPEHLQKKMKPAESTACLYHIEFERALATSGDILLARPITFILHTTNYITLSRFVSLTTSFDKKQQTVFFPEPAPAPPVVAQPPPLALIQPVAESTTPTQAITAPTKAKSTAKFAAAAAWAVAAPAKAGTKRTASTAALADEMRAMSPALSAMRRAIKMPATVAEPRTNVVLAAELRKMAAHARIMAGAVCLSPDQREQLNEISPLITGVMCGFALGARGANQQLRIAQNVTSLLSAMHEQE